MELASVLAGEPWSDHPRCAHPLLAAIARLVNDSVSDGARDSLLPLVPEVIGTRAAGTAVDPFLVIRCADAARRADPEAPGPVRFRRQALRRVAAAPSRVPLRDRAGALIYRGGQARHAVAVCVLLLGKYGRPDPDTALRRLLLDCIEVCGRAQRTVGGRARESVSPGNAVVPGAR
ncbi:MAG: hypothetical protein GEV11_17180 [Streptosporangiales bacterium]|nr:hypothetical protein [Streptosporangiales bacterium]